MWPRGASVLPIQNPELSGWVAGPRAGRFPRRARPPALRGGAGLVKRASALQARLQMGF